jgi:hypothetical protein
MNETYETRAKVRKFAQPRAAGRLPEAEIKRKTTLDALQHLTTLLPLAVCIISTIYLLLLSPMFGGAPGAIMITALSGISAVGSYLYRYTKEYPRNAREIVERLEEERVRLEEAELRRFSVTLQCEFLNIGSTEGLKALAGLTGAYEQLQASFAQRRMNDPLSLSLISALVGETYQRGLSVLSDALELMKVARMPDRESLEEEIEQLEMDFDVPKDEGIDAERLMLKEEKLASSKQRLGMLNRLQLYIDQLLYQVHRCEASLRATGIELASVRAGGSKTSVNSVVEALEATLNRVKEVQDELERIGRQE